MLSIVNNIAGNIAQHNPLIPLGRRIYFSLLDKVQEGEIVHEEMIDENGADEAVQNKTVFGRAAEFNGKPLRSKLSVRSDTFFVRLMLKADLGFAESYMLGEIDIEDLTSLLIILIKNRDHMNDLSVKTAVVNNFISYVSHSRLANSLSNAMSNIGAHYDLGNELFSSFLDETMLYSSAVWASPTESLYDAQMRKIQMLMDKAKIQVDEEVLEIGTGWGTFAIEAVKQRGCRVTTITLSKEQHDFALERIRHLPIELASRITLLLTDYRSLPDLFPGRRFDKIVSIEMIEAVGREFLTTYFSICDRMLNKQHGIMAFQVITMPESRYDNYCRSADFIQTYIFPGGHCPSLTALVESIQEASSGQLQVDQVDNIGPHYSRTLRVWREEFLANFDQQLKNFPKFLSQSQGRPWWSDGSEKKTPFYSEQFKRKWLYYFCYCEAGFATRSINNLQVVLSRDNNMQFIHGQEDVVL